ncbi:hypothetical protein [Nocardia carnea]|uniref:hypothetical protein n=1 Tax=Nocardia carnea TaxID=37328 RepID=UPI0024575B57|nr:hypothetical protein [Nocardia carnea]
MTRLRVAVSVVLAGVLLSGCAVEGLAVPVGSSYRASLGPDHERAIALQSNRDHARRLDPCAMVDEAAVIAAVGTPRHFGAHNEPDECELRFDRNTAIGGVGSLTVSLTVVEDGSGKRFQVGDRTAHTLDSGNLCHISLTYDDMRSFFYSISGREDADLCGQLRQIVTASAPLLDRAPKRSESMRMPATKAWTLDPCAALSSAYDPGQEITVNGIDPFECDFRLGYEHRPDELNRFHISFFHYSEGSANHPQPHVRRLQIVGVDATEHTGENDYCIIEINVGADNPFPVVNYDGQPEQWIEAMKVSGHGCTETRRIAVAAVKDYQKQ